MSRGERTLGVIGIMEAYFRDSKITLNLTGFVFVVPGVIIAARAPVHYLEKLFGGSGHSQTGMIISWVITTVVFYLLARWTMYYSYPMENWIKVQATPVNDERWNNDGSIKREETVGWEIIYDGKEHEVNDIQDARYTSDQEVYWNPKRNQVITDFLGNKLYFLIFAVMTSWCALEALNKSVVPQIALKHFFMVLAMPIGYIIYLEIKNRKAHPAPSQ